jgi:GntR family transcriptional regulator / MocR family aminotransferase
LSLPIPLERGGELTLQEQIYRFIRDQVLSGRYQAGLQLPSTRELADGLRVSRNTTVLAYQWLASEGYIETRQGAGTFIRRVISEAIEIVSAGNVAAVSENRPAIALKVEAPLLIDGIRVRPEFDFWYGRADARQFPTKIWARLVAESLAFARSSLTDYAPQAGLLALREAISVYLSTAKGLVASPERILITAGAQDGLNIIARLLIAPGDCVAIENPGYRAAATVFRSNGAHIAPVRIDDEGLMPSELLKIAPKLIYTTPSHQFPTGAVMSLERRQTLLATAESLNAYVIEDDYDGEIIYDRPPLAALAALDQHHRVIYVGSFSKSIGAGIRIGFLVLPAELMEWATALKSLASYGQPWTEQAALATFIREGSFRTHLRRIRTLYRARRDALISALRGWLGTDVEISGSDSGLHLVVRLPAGFPNAEQVSATARNLDIAFYTPEQAGAIEAGARDPAERRLVLGYAALTPGEIEAAVRRVAGVVRRNVSPG